MKGSAELTERLSLPEEVLSRLQSVRTKAAKSLPDAKPERRERPPSPAAPREIDSLDEANSQLAAAEELDAEFLAPRAAAAHPPYYWTWRVFSAGFTAAECEQIRNASRDTLLDHLAAARRAGLAVDPNWVVELDAGAPRNS
jgi:hypothetical protein